MTRNILTTYLARFSTVLSTLILVPIVAPEVGLKAFGLYALVTSMGVLFAQDLGMASATTRFAAQAHARGRSAELRSISSSSNVLFVGIALLLATGLTVAFMIVIPSLEIPAGVDATLLCALGIANVLLSMSLAGHRQVLSGIGRLDLVNTILIGQAVVRVAGSTLVVVVAPRVEWVATVDLAATALGSSLLWYLRRRVAPETNNTLRDFDSVKLRQLVRFSVDLLVMTLAAVTVLQSGALLSSLLLPLGAVAVYTAANRAFLFVREAANSLTTALLPAASAFAAGVDETKNRDLYLYGTRAANAIMIIVLVPVVVFAEMLLDIWVGSELGAGFAAAQILILSMLANNNHILAVAILTGMGRIRSYAVLHAIWAISGIALAPLLAPQLGVSGIALALSAPIILLEPLYIMFAIKALQLPARDFLLRAIVAPYAVAAIPAAALVASAAAFGQDRIAPMILTSTAWVLLMSLLNWRILLTRPERRLIIEHVAAARTHSGRSINRDTRSE